MAVGTAVLFVALWAVPAAAQQEIDASKIYMGSATITSSGTSIVLSALNVTGNSVLGGTLEVNASIGTPAATSLTLNPTGDLITNPTGNDVLPYANYDINIGSLTTKYLALHAAELWVNTLVAQETMATIGGRIIVAPTSVLTADLAAAATTMSIKHNEMTVGDRAFLESNGKFEVIRVSAGPTGAGPYDYTIVRDLDTSGANDWYAGDAVLNIGQAGDGFIDIYSVRGRMSASQYGPTIVGQYRSAGAWTSTEPRWAIGNLDGLYGYSGTTYGAAFGVPAGAWVKIDPTNGVRLGYDATTKVQIEADGDATFSGAVTAASGSIGGWTIGSTSLTDTAGVVGMSSAVTAGDDIRFWAGDATPSSAEFSVTEAGVLTASSATVTGTITASGGLTKIDSSGISIAAGDTDAYRIKWRDGIAGAVGAYIQTVITDPLDEAYLTLDSDNYITLDAANIVNITFGTSTVSFDTAAVYGGATVDLGTSTFPWDALYIDPSTTTAAYYPLVLNGYNVLQKTDGLNGSQCGSGVDGFTAEYGIVTAVTCAAPQPDAAPAALLSRIATLEAQVAALTALLARQ